MSSIKYFIYGKIPLDGDFVFRGDDYKVFDFLEKWSTQYMEALPSQFPIYKEYWLSVPVWSFCAPFSWFNGYTFGLLLHSCDSVGREFPLIILLVFGTEKDFLSFCDKKNYFLIEVKKNYKRLLINDLLTNIQEISNEKVIDKSYFIGNSNIMETIHNQHTLWWAEGRRDFFVREYNHFPFAEDLLLYYGL